jgi:hypothetical protein
MYKIIFIDRSEWMGGEPNNSLWNSMPNKPIKEIKYSLFNQSFILNNYDAYNHLAERTSTLDGQQSITKVFLMGKKGNRVDIIVFDLQKKQIYKQTKEFEKEYYGNPTSGWKQGIYL